MSMTLEIFQGDSDTLTETVSNLSSLSGYSAKLYITSSRGTAIATLTGTIVGLVITYQILNDASKIYPVGIHKYESKIYDASDHVYTTSHGRFLVKTPINSEPNA